ncbi:HD-GYP domain-containing protein [Clostridium sp.]|uniref:HD-GYP domain-containing protein n=1 Tax=Clostridium sp. TaxID=1506 RepID=UPI003463DE1F
MRKSNKITPYSLEPGMTLAKDIYLNDVKIVGEGIVLNEKIINKIKTLYNLSDIYIFDEVDELENEAISSKASDDYKITEKTLKTVSIKAKEMFDSVKNTSKINLAEVRSISEDLLSNLKHTGLIIKNITEDRRENYYEYRHLVNVAVLSALMAKWLELSQRESLLLIYSGFLHDIGKSKMPESILYKSGPLTTKEKTLIKSHPIKGYDLVKNIQFLDPSVGQAILLHHERLDGSGYPLGLKDNKIPMFSRIIAIADIFDSMTSNRCYRAKESPLKALEVIKEDSYKKLDMKLANVFINNMCDYYTGEIALLSDGSKAKIIKIDPIDITHPLVSVKDEFIDLKVEKSLNIVDIL